MSTVIARLRDERQFVARPRALGILSTDPVTARRGACALLCVLLTQVSWVGASGSAQPANAAIASAHAEATAAGRAIVDQGGNAFDAAVAVAAALAVVEPYSSGLGGGGFFLLSRAADGKRVMIDAREKAPVAARADMYLDPAGEFVPERSLNGPLAAGIPGLAAALAHVSREYGRIELAATLAPAIRLAREGFTVSARYQTMAEFRANALSFSAEATTIFLQDGAAPTPGHVIVQQDLAATLEQLARRGATGFYTGEIAQRLVAGVRAAGGIWTAQDLADYKVVEREPVTGQYHGVRVVSAPPPSSGGVALMQALNILEPYDLAARSAYLRRHLVIEAMRRAYRDRAQYLGDPDYVRIPVTRLIARDYAREQARGVSFEHATPSADLPGIGATAEGRDTTHFSILDTEGNAVAATLSINYPFGAAFVPPGTGVLLNNEMDDFSARPLTANAYGLVGDQANAIAPGKRPLSSMTPTLLETPQRMAILGTPGGSRIISMVLIATLSFVEGKSPAEWVAAKRFHHQYLPDEVQFEKGGLSPAAQADLRERGHELQEVSRPYGNMQAILWDRERGVVTAASDPRGEGRAVVWLPNADSAGNRSSSAGR